jgi:competence ComEA-like helix-hairpin-helix protein
MNKKLVLGCVLVLCIGFSLVLAGAANAQAPAAGKVNVNQATSASLMKVPGMTEDVAKALVEYRSKSGALKSADDLMKVPGMTKEKADAIAPNLAFGPAKAQGDDEEAKLPRY